MSDKAEIRKRRQEINRELEEIRDKRRALLYRYRKLMVEKEQLKTTHD